MEKPTTERLAEALAQLKPRTNALRRMIKKARAGYYDDYKSSIATPILQLAEDIEKAGHPEFVERIRTGEFDGTREESEEWAASPEGKATFAELLRGRQKKSDLDPAFFHQFAAANPEIVKPLIDAMYHAYGDYCNAVADTNSSVSPVDAFMAAHNIHCWILQSLEQQFGFNPAEQLALRKIAVDTFRKSMEERG